MNKNALDRFFLNTSTPAERAAVVDWMLNPANDPALKSWMKENWELLPATAIADDAEPNVDLIWNRIRATLQEEATQRETVPPSLPGKPAVTRPLFRILAAACLLAIVGTGLYFLLRPAPDENMLAAYGSAVVRHDNKSGQPEQLFLDDSSVVILSAHASLQYPAHFTGDKREVVLTGEAFFDIRQNAALPFQIYSNNIVTRVLGTSFTINASPGDEQVVVSVHSGRVQVLEKKALVQGSGKQPKTTNGVILTANQKTVYTKEKNDFQVTLVDAPALLEQRTAKKELFEFKRERLPVLLSRLEKAYGIEIILESERLNTCTFSGDLTEENLYEKLDLICASVNAVYEISGTKILIKGQGCN